MNSLYDLSVQLSFRGLGLQSGIATAMGLLNRLQNQTGQAQGQIDRLGKAFKLFAAGAAITGVGVGILAFLDDAIKKAMTLQTVMTGVGQVLTNARGVGLSPGQ